MAIAARRAPRSDVADDVGVDELTRSLTTRHAVVVGLGAMLGAGVFVVFAPAARAAGSALLVGLALAFVVAAANAASSAQLAAQYPTSGGAYVYGTERLGPWPGFLAGWCFVTGKVGSAAAMALTVAAYTVPAPWARAVAAAAVVALTAVGMRGVTRTVRVTGVVVAGVLVVLATTVGFGLTGGAAPSRGAGADGGGWGVLQAASLLFFAFAGYARVATLGEEVAEPRRSIPRAIAVALGVVLVVYTLVATVCLRVLGADRLAASYAPLRDVAAAAGPPWLVPVVQVTAALAALGALAALLPGISRTVLAMARRRDLPPALAAVHPRYAVPHRAEAAVAAVVVVLVLTTDLRVVVGFSSFGVLTYYAVTNAAAWTQDRADRLVPRGVPALGLAGCVALALSVPVPALVAGAAVAAVGLAGRAVVVRRRAAVARRRD